MDDRTRSQHEAREELLAAGIPLPRPALARPRPGQTLLASAQRVTSYTLQRGWGKSKAWQNDGWEMYDLIGEVRFLAVTLANRMSQAKIFVGTMPTDDTEDPVPVEDPNLTAILDSIGSSAAARAQMIARLGVNLFVAGDGWLVGIPRHLVPENLLVGTLSEPIIDPDLIPVPDPDDTMDITTLDWRMLSISEVATMGTGEVQLRLGETLQDQVMCSPDDLILIRVWRPHPRFWWEADSPVRSSLPVLRELVGLTMRSSAEIDSRLAGAGLLIIPQSAQRALQVAAGIEGDLDGAPDQFTEALMEAMITPIQDRASASAIVPLVVTVPDEACALFNFMDFSKPLDQYASERMDKAIRRVALGLDAPPELLLGTAGMNHWGAWLVLEDVVTTHLEPPLALICDALTTQYLWPVLVEQGMSIEEAKQHVIWYDVSDLVVRPTRSADALGLHSVGAISDVSLREATGFDDSDAPVEETAQPLEVTIALDLVKGAPSLMSDPGLLQLVAQIRAALNGEIPEAVDPGTPAAPTGETGDAPPSSAPTPSAQPAGELPGQGVQTPDQSIPSIAASSGYTDPVKAWARALAEDSAGDGPPGPLDSGPVAAGVAIWAADTGRVLMLQRSLDPEDPAAGTWEFPGGKIDPGESPEDAARREWREETGQPLPEGQVTADWTSSNGVYVGFVLPVASEVDVPINLDLRDRHVLNPDDPDQDMIEVLAWWKPEHLVDNPALRRELAMDLDLVLEALGAEPMPEGVTAAALDPTWLKRRLTESQLDSLAAQALAEMK